MGFNNSVLTKINENIKEKLKKKNEISNQNKEDEEIEDINLSSLISRKKPNKKKPNNTNITKDLDSIINKYRNMK